ncbi:hypothetical protein A3E39_02810 [Candidatus Uhrbacteria bacterium RIFCSPHIGHO2_12_FULL_60_25]|uniref:Protein kinase domain-containing protein n=1 Tax=Candidatus Uhrbacteria bacterium RIFCSPHIGHO2_12_FULL_60_25 TaxID=1802399 RepID=A0A1F7UJI0_9BACT|nr:MAG: hypothetical protein A3D73_00075 [Candidatus Uhrbacteria bacterium RIFCSPHIGHO2_02_FULL_60_44]OGL78405.1 MAG: hypothetical protein A3E39_02810 [Candidatus Uhrbacteria bacterium RIFCSPHIGHO2_12_FULL_60_25]
MDDYQHTAGVVIGGRYKLVEPVGVGGMAEVWKGLDLRMQSAEVAIKFMHFHLLRSSFIASSTSSISDQEEVQSQFVERFLREVATNGKLIQNYSKSYAVRIHDTDKDEYGIPYFVMDFVHGTPFSNKIEHYAYRAGLPPPGQVDAETNEVPLLCLPQSVYPLLDLYRINDQILDFVGYMHKNGVIHRDLKPSNIMIVMDKNGVSIRILDFGIAKLTEEAFSATGSNPKLTKEFQQMGTPDYMPEELYFGQSQPDETGKVWHAGPHTDLYAIGTMLFEAVTGRLPYGGLTTQERMRAICTDSFPLPDPSVFVRDLNPLLVNVIRKGIAKHPWERYQDAAEMLNDLRNAERIDRERSRAATMAVVDLNEAIPLSFRPTVPHESQPMTPVYPSPAPLPLGLRQSDGLPPVADRLPSGNRPRTTMRSVSGEDLQSPSFSLALGRASALLILLALVIVGGLWWLNRTTPEAQVRFPDFPSATPPVSVKPPPVASRPFVAPVPAGPRKRLPQAPSRDAQEALRNGRMMATGPVKDCHGALVFYEAARAASPETPDVYLEIGECERKLGRIREARDAFRTYLTFDGVPPLPPSALALVR